MHGTGDPQSMAEVQPASQVSYEFQGNQQNPPTMEASGVDSGSASIASSDNRKVSCEDIELVRWPIISFTFPFSHYFTCLPCYSISLLQVQNLIERCLQLYMNREEVVRTLSDRARIEPGFTTLVWKKLEEENSEFFRAYYIRLKLKKQIILFNYLLEHQYHLMKYPVSPKVPLVPVQNGIHPMQVNNLPMGYPVLWQPPMPTIGQPHVDPMGCGLSSCHVVNGVPASGSFHPIHMNSGKGIATDSGAPEAAPAVPCRATLSVSETAAGPASVALRNHFPFTPSELSGMSMDASTLDTNFTSDVANTGMLQLGPDGEVGSSRDSLRSVGQLWNFNLTDLTADFTNLRDLGALGSYTGSPFLPSDSDILLDSPEQEDIVEEYFADAITEPCSQSDEENHTELN
ncbi:uncharacterized protein LOC103706913 isoform X2 [Phoenix dactylifera]|uniref:Uncharacterized protein LOC103706913 isoform X2 n=1 Tax=Phoenix dactylifera TaxID=42345 RepID=A0A8B9AIT3_PHODC|nr:uncharacterized protein LOC103706913 isoform X2 [Phoenix dactylifera]